MDEQGQNQDGPSGEATAMVGLACLAIALLLALLLPFVTHTQPAGKAWFLSPRNIPILAIAMIGLPGLILSLRLLRGWRVTREPPTYIRSALSAFGDLRPALGYTVLFCIYMAAIPVLGFAISTLLFGQACLLASGLTGRRWMAWNLAFTVVIVVLLRGVMGLWFPHAWIFAWLPGGIGNVIGPYL